MTKLKLLFVFIAIFLNGCKNCEDIEVPYTEQIPYEVYENVPEKPKYNVNANIKKEWECLSKDFWGNCDQKRWFLAVEVPIENFEDEPVDFTVILYVNTYYEGDIQLKNKVTVPANSTRTVEFKHNLQSETAEYKKPTYEIIEGTIEKRKLVTKYRTETKYRKCNTCAEDCEGYKTKKSGVPWWGYVLGGFFLIVVLRGILQLFGIIEKD